MRLELALVFSLIAAGSVFAETAAEEPQENPELEREIAYVGRWWIRDTPISPLP